MLPVVLVQSDVINNDLDATAKRIENLIQEANPQAGSLVVLSEMFLGGFTLATGEAAIQIEQKSRALLADLAQTYQVTMVGSYPECAINPHRPFNTLGIYTPTGLQGEYRKRHLFSYGKETEHYEAGKHLLSWTLADVRISFFICYDLRFPIPFYTLAEQTDLFVVVAHWPSRRRDHWTTLLRARAIENQAYVIGVNRIGDAGDCLYTGDSLAISPKGETLASPMLAEATATVCIDPQEVRQWRQTFPMMHDRR